MYVKENNFQDRSLVILFLTCLIHIQLQQPSGGVKSREKYNFMVSKVFHFRSLYSFSSRDQRRRRLRDRYDENRFFFFSSPDGLLRWRIKYFSPLFNIFFSLILFQCHNLSIFYTHTHESFPCVVPFFLT